MVLVEKLASVVEVRAGRKLYVRNALVGPSTSEQVGLQLIFVHGTCGSEQQFQLLLECLDKSLRQEKVNCILFDNPGCGQSPPAESFHAYSNNEIRADISAVIEQYADKDTPTVLIGHSYGPSTFLPMIRANPALLPNLKGVVLLGTAVRSTHLEHADGGHIIMKLPVGILCCIQTQLTEIFLKIAVHPDHTELKQLIRQASNSNDMAVAKAYHRHVVFATEQDLPVIADLPALIVHGADDNLLPIQCAQHLHNCLPNSTLKVVERASHLVMMEQPQEVADAVVPFLAQFLS